jgi:hypothetical protein
MASETWHIRDSCIQAVAILINPITVYLGSPGMYAAIIVVAVISTALTGADGCEAVAIGVDT